MINDEINNLIILSKDEKKLRNDEHSFNNDSRFLDKEFKLKTIVDIQTKNSSPTTFFVIKSSNFNKTNSYKIEQLNKKSSFPCAKRRKLTAEETMLLKKDGKYYKFKPSTHPMVREEQIKIMNEHCTINKK